MRNGSTASAHRQLAARKKALEISNSGALQSRLERLMLALAETDRKMELARRKVDSAQLTDLGAEWDALHARWEELVRKR